MSAARMTYLIVVPALVAMLGPLLGMAFPDHLSSATGAKFGLFVSLTFIVLYAAGVACLALHDHRRINARCLSLRR
jgi:hypothetical protein